MKKVFIDGSAGTTGLKIRQRLLERKDITLMILPEDLRKDPQARKTAINESDITFLCLPDDAAIEAVSFCENPDTVIIDTSTAHRTNPDWVYGFEEVVGRDKLAASKRIANPGCHASGFIALIKPLRDAGIISENAHLCCFSLTGYSGGGKKMIAQYEADNRDPLFNAPRQYALTQSHKHLKEMSALCRVPAPAFCPIVGDFYSGMEVSIPLFCDDIKLSADDIRSIYREKYNSAIVHFDDAPSEEGFLSAAAFSERDDMQISVWGNDERILLVARYDNLGKGASGSAVQNMNAVLGLDSATGLKL
ncbi:MAG: N-acetyl-gamma-glutamyl-phosphate reductase [Ruminococcaceae bacterium]|nr:N-acetyl-gamma-glutamyl-phosphate reductase [Oscillospiraceae bacterium]